MPACWNIYIMPKLDHTDRQLRHSALLARELVLLDIDIAAVSEVWFSE